MTDSQLLKIRRGDLLLDGGGRQWVATCDAFQEPHANHCYVMARRGCLVQKLTLNTASDWSVPRLASYATL